MGDQVPLRTSVAISGGPNAIVSVSHTGSSVELVVSMPDESRVARIELQSGDCTELGHALIAMAAELETPRPKPPKVKLYRGVTP